MLRKMLTTLTFPLAAIALAVGLIGCAPAAGDVAAPNSSGQTIEVPADAVILDVRTPQEYASGHLTGATVLDFNAGEVAARAAALDPEQEYYVYCRSGSRSSQAVKLLQAAGIEQVTDLGGLDAAAVLTGIPVIAE